MPILIFTCPSAAKLLLWNNSLSIAPARSFFCVATESETFENHLENYPNYNTVKSLCLPNYLH